MGEVVIMVKLHNKKRKKRRYNISGHCIICGAKNCSKRHD